jgi:hypothetical protein
MTSARTSASEVARRVLDLCRLQGGPQDFPHAPGLLAGLLGAGVALDLLIGSALGRADDALARSLLSSAVVLGLCWVALALRRLPNRYVQTASALLACSLAFSLVQLPIVLLAGPPPATAAELSGMQILLGWLTLALFVWQISVDAHIMRNAMEGSFGFAFALVVSWVLAFWALDRALFGSA